MLVIHPSDCSTDFLRALYQGMEGVDLRTGGESRNALSSLLFHLPPGERVMLLGHGGPEGLYRLEDGILRCYVGRSMRFVLRRHPLVGIWCHADTFARQASLHGIFSGMVVSEMQEALDYGIDTSRDELERENRLFAATLQRLLDAGVPAERIPVLMRDAIGDGPTVRAFNYNSIFYL